jgi:benzoyl-CoA reductase/2-hydroxyglutaryl-CoA dehydratase subunit BcrC/BadD/HgdB
MANLSDKLKQIEQIATKPRMMLDKYLAEGKKVVGCFALYTPEQLVHAAGIIPMGLWGGKVEPYLAKQYNPAITCPIMMTTFEFGLNGSYKGLSAVLIPCSLCDILRCVSQNWKSGVDIPMIPFTLPQNRDIEASVDFLVSEYELVKERLENISGNKITDEALKNSIDIYNKHNATMREFAEVANLHLDIITPSVRHNIMKSAMFVEKQAHTKMVREIIDELNAIPVHEWKGKRVILTEFWQSQMNF